MTDRLLDTAKVESSALSGIRPNALRNGRGEFSGAGADA